MKGNLNDVAMAVTMYLGTPVTTQDVEWMVALMEKAKVVTTHFCYCEQLKDISTGLEHQTRVGLTA
jgi:hypothetical protein